MFALLKYFEESFAIVCVPEVFKLLTVGTMRCNLLKWFNYEHTKSLFNTLTVIVLFISVSTALFIYIYWLQRARISRNFYKNFNHWLYFLRLTLFTKSFIQLFKNFHFTANRNLFTHSNVYIPDEYQGFIWLFLQKYAMGTFLYLFFKDSTPCNDHGNLKSLACFQIFQLMNVPPKAK